MGAPLAEMDYSLRPLHKDSVPALTLYPSENRLPTLEPLRYVEHHLSSNTIANCQPYVIHSFDIFVEILFVIMDDDHDSTENDTIFLPSNNKECWG